MASDSDFSRQSVPELISFLKSSFLEANFDEVESVLVSRESKLQSEIERKEQDNKLCKEILAILVDREKKLMSEIHNIRRELDLLKEEYKVERIEKIKLENKLQLCRAQIVELGERDSQISKEIKQFRDLENNCRRRAEAEIEMWRRRFRDLEMSIVKLEKDASELKKVENNVVTDGMKGDKEERDLNCKDDVKLRSAAMLNSGRSRPPSHAIVEITDNHEVCDAGGSLVSKDRDVYRAHSGHRSTGNGTRMLKRKQPSSPNLVKTESGRDRDHNDNVDESVWIGKHGMREAAVPIRGPFDSVVNK